MEQEWKQRCKLIGNYEIQGLHRVVEGKYSKGRDVQG